MSLFLLLHTSLNEEPKLEPDAVLSLVTMLEVLEVCGQVRLACVSL